MEALELANKLVGVTVAVIGAVLVAPNGARLLLRSLRQWSAQAIATARQKLGLPGRVHHLEAHDTLSISESSRVYVGSARGDNWDPSGPVDERIANLRRRVEELQAGASQLSRSLAGETAARQAAVQELGSRLSSELAQVRADLSTIADQTARIDARGLPLIAAGIVLSGIPEELARWIYPVGWGLPVGAFLLALAVVAQAVRTRRADRLGSRP